MLRGRSMFLLGILACGGGATPATTPSGPASPPGNGACAPAYAEYERHWGVALEGELADTAATEPEMAREIVEQQLAVLPDREELGKLRTMYAVVDLFVSDAPWPRAFAAADAAIEQCGERAKRPPR